MRISPLLVFNINLKWAGDVNASARDRAFATKPLSHSITPSKACKKSKHVAAPPTCGCPHLPAPTCLPEQKAKSPNDHRNLKFRSKSLAESNEFACKRMRPCLLEAGASHEQQAFVFSDLHTTVQRVRSAALDDFLQTFEHLNRNKCFVRTGRSDCNCSAKHAESRAMQLIRRSTQL